MWDSLDGIGRRYALALAHAAPQWIEEGDGWTIYRALSELLEGLGGRSPVDAAKLDAPGLR